MNRENFILTVGDTTVSYSVTTNGKSAPFIGPVLETKHSSLGHELHRSSVLMDASSIRALGKYLIEKADEFDKFPSDMLKSYVCKVKPLDESRGM